MAGCQPAGSFTVSPWAVYVPRRTSGRRSSPPQAASTVAAAAMTAEARSVRIIRCTAGGGREVRRSRTCSVQICAPNSPDFGDRRRRAVGSPHRALRRRLGSRPDDDNDPARPRCVHRHHSRLRFVVSASPPSVSAASPAAAGRPPTAHSSATSRRRAPARAATSRRSPTPTRWRRWRACSTRPAPSTASGRCVARRCSPRRPPSRPRTSCAARTSATRPAGAPSTPRSSWRTTSRCASPSS